MNQSRLWLGLAALACSLASLPASAVGALAFLSTPTTVRSGEASSWMNAFSDCPATNCAPAGVPLPVRSGSVVVTTQATGGNMGIKFSIPDGTRTNAVTGNTSLVIGDMVIVQIDPNGNRGAVLETGATPDLRFEITIRDGKIFDARRKVPNAAGTNWGLAGVDIWPCSTSNTVTTCTSSQNQGSVVLDSASDYVVQLSVPVTAGWSTTEFGLAMAVINDLGQDTGGVHNLTAVTFPATDMPAGNIGALDPGLVPTVPAGLPWKTPNNWGRGFLVAPTGGAAQLTFSHSPEEWVADAIKLAFCDVTNYSSIDPADTTLIQTTLANWYRYEKNNPCSMGIWIKVRNGQPTAATARVAILWSDPGLLSQQWRVVQLSDPILFPAGPGDSVFRIVWDKVPSGGFAGRHPCLRVYLLPAALTGQDGGVTYDKARIEAISNDAQLAGFERAYLFPGWPLNQQTAQMNFTNLGTDPDCTRPNCRQPMRITEFGQFLIATLDSLGPRPAHAQPPRRNGLEATPVKESNISFPPPKEPFAIVNIAGFSVPAKQSKAPYRFMESTGGMSYAVPVAIGKASLAFGVTAPKVLYRDFGGKAIKEMKGQPRRIFLAVTTNAPEGVKVNVKVPTDLKVLDPGKSRKVEATVTLSK